MVDDNKSSLVVGCMLLKVVPNLCESPSKIYKVKGTWNEYWGIYDENSNVWKLFLHPWGIYPKKSADW